MRLAPRALRSVMRSHCLPVTVPPKSRGDPRVDGLIAGFDPLRREVAEALRAAIRENAAELTETVRMGVPTYVGRAPVLYIAEYKDHVNLGFYRGAHLEDRARLLEGTGKSLRHVKLYRTDQVRDPRLAELIREAAARDAT